MVRMRSISDRKNIAAGTAARVEFILPSNQCGLMPNPSLSDNNGDVRAENHSLIDELISTVATGSVKQRLRIFQRVTDLLVAGARSYSSQQIALFDDVLQQLSVDIEVKVRAEFAHRLAGMDSAPPSSSAHSLSTTRLRWPDRSSSIRSN
jgi:hypothetical protein